MSTYLIGTGLIDSTQAAAIPLATHIAAAIAEWERRTGWQPFLAGSASDRQFDPPGPNRGTGLLGYNRGGGNRLYLEGGLAAEPSSVIVGYSTTDAGTTLTAETQYWCEPYNALAKGEPYTWLVFVAHEWGQQKSLKVNGRWGYTTSLSDDVWQAILELGSLKAFAGIAGQNVGGLVQWQEEAMERYGEKPYQAYYTAWKASTDAMVQLYQRMSL